MLRTICILCLTSLLGCQSLLGFRDFEGESATAADADDDAEAMAVDDDAMDAGQRPGSSPDDGSNDDAPTVAPGGGVSEGSECGGKNECESGLTCLYGLCRPPCNDDTECAQGRECLFAAGRGGCRLAAETCKGSGDCANADLVCGIDGVCRVDCSTQSCDAPTQRCIAGTCVSTVGERASDWDCAGADDGDVVCSGSRLEVCNVSKPGLAEIEACDNASVCQISLPSNGRYDAADPPACAAACAAASAYCDGATLLVCNDDGSGPIDEGQECATGALCEGSVNTDSATCLDPACETGDVRCAGGQTELVVQGCNDDRTAFEDLATCDGASAQCNPGASACFDLDIDQSEVSMAAYQSWLDGSPPLLNQPSGCSWNDTFEPDPGCLGDGAVLVADGQPQVCIDWCDAYAYCAGQGRRLCGRIAGGMNDFDAYDDPSSSQWMNACSAGGQYAWETGDPPPPDPVGCVHSGSQVSTPYAVGTHANCSSPSPGYEQLRDLSGNVEEWEDSCERDAESGSASASDACRTRGGSFETPRDATRCDAVPASAKTRSDFAPTLGFRCCG